jgi:hypothetical protein
VNEQLRLYHPGGGDHGDKVAVVAVQPSSAKAGWLIVQLARGPSRAKLVAKLFGPMTPEEAAATVSKFVMELTSAGFMVSGVGTLLHRLQSKDPKKRARAALRLGWRRQAEAVEPLLNSIATSGEAVSSIVDALGRLGDPRAIPAVRAEAERKLLSRRRSGVEALRNLQDAAGLAQSRTRSLERLPEEIRKHLGEQDEANARPGVVQAFVTLLDATPEKDRGLALDTLYELATPLCMATVRAVLAKTAFDEPHVWRYVKSVFKRALLRNDVVTFGLLAHAIEFQGRKTSGKKATVKSGYDGQLRETRIFGKTTQDFMRRLAWRHLQHLATFLPDQYAPAAAEAVLHYSEADEVTPKKAYGKLSSCYVLHRIIYGASKRFVLNSRKLRFKFDGAAKTVDPPDQVREEAHPDLWDAQPAAYIRLLGGAKLERVQRFAYAGLHRGHLDVLRSASHADVAALLDASYEPTIELGLAELTRRFDPAKPDWNLLATLARDHRPRIRDLGLDWLNQTAPLWSSDVSRVFQFLGLGDALVRDAVAKLAHDGLAKAEKLARRDLAKRILGVLRSKEPEEGAHSAYARVARTALIDEVSDLLSLDDALALITNGSESSMALAAVVLGRKPGALKVLGLPRVIAMATDERATIRLAAHGLLRVGIDVLRSDPSPLFLLVGSEWADTRAVMIDLLLQIDLMALGLDGLLGLADSNRVEVQNLAQQLIVKHLDVLDSHELIGRLGQHPHPNMRRFAVELTVRHLKPGFVRLARLEQMFRSALFDLWPERAVKLSVIDFLGRRGLQDENQAGVAAGILGDFARTKGSLDRDRALTALVKIQLQFSALSTSVKLHQGAS